MIKTGTKRKHFYCKICKESYLDFCVEHFNIPNSWEMRD